MRSVLGVASGPTPATDGSVGDGSVGDEGLPGCVDRVNGADWPGRSEVVFSPDDSVSAEVLAPTRGGVIPGVRRRGATRSDGTDGRDEPAPSCPAGPGPPTAKRSSGRLTPSADNCSRSAAIS